MPRYVLYRQDIIGPRYRDTLTRLLLFHDYFIIVFTTKKCEAKIILVFITEEV